MLPVSLQSLADVLVSIAVRQLVQSVNQGSVADGDNGKNNAHAGNKNARPVDGWTSNNLERGNDNREIEETHTVQKLW